MESKETQFTSKKGKLVPVENDLGNFASFVGNFGKQVLAPPQTSLRPEDRPESTVPTSPYTVSEDADAKCELSLLFITKLRPIWQMN